MKRIVFVGVAVLFMGISTSPAHGEYCAVGEIKGNVCGFLGFVCKFVRIDAVRGDDGGLYTVNPCHESVTDYDESKNRCWIKTKSTKWGAISWLVNTAKQPEFLHKTASGEYEDLDVEYVTFECVRQ